MLVLLKCTNCCKQGHEGSNTLLQQDPLVLNGNAGQHRLACIVYCVIKMCARSSKNSVVKTVKYHANQVGITTVLSIHCDCLLICTLERFLLSNYRGFSSYLFQYCKDL